MSTMIERVARAIRRKYNVEIFGRDEDSGWEFSVDQARAAIEAMREPTPAQLTATEEVVTGYDDFACGDGTLYLSYPGSHDRAKEAWTTMIDAALQETTN